MASITIRNLDDEVKGAYIDELTAATCHRACPAVQRCSMTLIQAAKRPSRQQALDRRKVKRTPGSATPSPQANHPRPQRGRCACGCIPAPPRTAGTSSSWQAHAGLRQTAGGPLRPPGGSAAVAAGACQFHQPRALRRLGGTHPCALLPRLVGALLSPGRQLRVQEQGPDLGPGLVPVGMARAAGRRPWPSRRAAPISSAPGSPRAPRHPAGRRAGRSPARKQASGQYQRH